MAEDHIKVSLLLAKNRNRRVHLTPEPGCLYYVFEFGQENNILSNQPRNERHIHVHKPKNIKLFTLLNQDPCYNVQLYKKTLRTDIIAWVGIIKHVFLDS